MSAAHTVYTWARIDLKDSKDSSRVSLGHLSYLLKLRLFYLRVSSPNE